jgi:hypothetical protein
MEYVLIKLNGARQVFDIQRRFQNAGDVGHHWGWLIKMKFSIPLRHTAL